MTRLDYKVGDKVLLQLGVDYESAPKGLQRWDGCQFVIDKARFVMRKGWVYELKSCKSPKGVTYSIVEDWLLPVAR